MLQTRRLDLIPATAEHLERELRHPRELEPLLGAIVTAEWPPGEYDREAMRFFLTRLNEDGAAAVGWYVWYAVVRNPTGRRETLVAGAGFHGPPAAGLVEIGFSVIPSARRQGFATEIVAALADYAFASGHVTAVIAQTTLANAASVKVLERAGFQMTGPGEEPDTVRFRLQKPESVEKR